jgi:hypothetical protein
VTLTFHNGKLALRGRLKRPGVPFSLNSCPFSSLSLSSRTKLCQAPIDMDMYISRVSGYGLRQSGVIDLRPKKIMAVSHRCDRLPQMDGTPKNFDVHACRRPQDLTNIVQQGWMFAFKTNDIKATSPMY